MDTLNAIDLPFMDKVNAFGGMIVAVLTYALGEHWYLFAAFLLFNVFDYVTGVWKSKLLKTESSSAGLRGIIKKFGYWFMIVLAFVLGAIMNEIGVLINTDLSAFTPMIGWLILAMMAFNELRSILENLSEIGVPVPTFLTKGLKVFADKANSIGDAIFDGDLEIDPQKDDDTKYRVDLKTPDYDLKERDSVTLKIKTVKDERY